MATQRLLPEFQKYSKSAISGESQKCVITMNPNTASPGEELYVDIPRLKSHLCLVPESLFLRFNIETSDITTKSTVDGKEVTSTKKAVFKNNLGKNLVERLVVKVGGNVVYDNLGEGILGLYTDLWKPQSERVDMMEEGILGGEVRKAISGASGVSEDGKLLGSVYRKQKINLGKILENHGVQVPAALADNFQYIITLGSNATVMEAAGEYTLKNLELEYETIQNEKLVKSTMREYSRGKVMGFKHVTLLRKEEWKKDTTIVNTTINLPRKGMNSIVMLFSTAGKQGTEEFVNPGIEKVMVTIEGVPGSVYLQGITKPDLLTEAKKVFGASLTSGTNGVNTRSMGPLEFYKNKFALVVDLRTCPDDEVVGCGKKLDTAQSGILLEISKTVSTDDLRCYTFVLSDGILEFKGDRMDSVIF